MRARTLNPNEFCDQQADLTEILCWTRIQAEAGETLPSIVLRKELERSAGDGIFCWGVGNAPALAVTAFARACRDIDVVFSRMKTRHPSLF
jgi:hypothetical protein